MLIYNKQYCIKNAVFLIAMSVIGVQVCTWQKKMHSMYARLAAFKRKSCALNLTSKKLQEVKQSTKMTVNGKCILKIILPLTILSSVCTQSKYFSHNFNGSLVISLNFTFHFFIDGSSSFIISLIHCWRAWSNWVIIFSRQIGLYLQFLLEAPMHG